MFDWGLNTPLHMCKLSNNISLCCNTEQLQNGRHCASFFTHLHREQSPLQVQVNMYSFRLISYPQQTYWSTPISSQPEMKFDNLVLMLRSITNQHLTLNVNHEAAKCILSGEAFSVCFHSTL